MPSLLPERMLEAIFDAGKWGGVVQIDVLGVLDSGYN